jgi:hypothetical protein
LRELVGCSAGTESAVSIAAALWGERCLSSQSLSRPDFRRAGFLIMVRQWCGQFAFDLP